MNTAEINKFKVACLEYPPGHGWTWSALTGADDPLLLAKTCNSDNPNL